MGGHEKKFIDKAFNENWIAPVGPNLDGFEQDIKNYSESDNCVVLTSGTAALHLALATLGVTKDDYVIVQSFTFCGSANPVKYLGAIPVYIDSESETWNMCPKFLRKALVDFKSKGILGRVKAILPVHLYGMPAKMDEIISIAEEFGVSVIEDAAESLGATVNGKQTGTFGVMGVYSFNGNKIITTSGGGALIGNEAKHINLAKKLSTQAREDAPYYEHEMIGYNYRLSNVSAGIGRGQMMVLDEHIQKRRANFERYMSLFKQMGKEEGIQIQIEGGIRFANRWLTAVYLNPKYFGENASNLLRLHLEQKNIEARPLWKPMHMQPIFKNSIYYGGNVCEDLFNHGICLPSGSNLTEQDWERIESSIISHFS